MSSKELKNIGTKTDCVWKEGASTKSMHWQKKIQQFKNAQLWENMLGKTVCSVVAALAVAKLLKSLFTIATLKFLSANSIKF